MRVEFDKVIAEEGGTSAIGLPRDIDPILPDADTRNLSPSTANALRDAWIKHETNKPGTPFYIMPMGGGQQSAGGFRSGGVIRIGPDNTGRTVVATPLVQEWKLDPDRPSQVFTGPGDPWDAAYDAIDFNFIVAPWLSDEAFSFYSSASSYYKALSSAWYLSKELRASAMFFYGCQPPDPPKRLAASPEYRNDLINLITSHGGMTLQDLFFQFVEKIESGHQYLAENTLEDIAYYAGLQLVVEQLEWLRINHPENTQAKQELLSTGKPIDLASVYPGEDENPPGVAAAD